MSLSETHRHLVPPVGWLDGDAEDPAVGSMRFLVFASLVGMFLRLFRLTGPSLWVDEMLTWQALRPGSGVHGFGEQFLDTIQGPLFLAVLWPLVDFWEPVMVLRLPSVLAGIVAVPLFGILAFRLTGPRAGRLAVLLFALSPFHIWYSQEGRGYSFLVLFSLLAVLLYLTMQKRGPGPGLAILFGLAGAAACLSNLAGVFLLVALGLGLVVCHRPVTRRAWGWWGLAFGLALVLTLPWLLKASGIWAVSRVIPGSGMGEALRGESTFSLMALPYTVHTFFYGYSLGPSLREWHGSDIMAIARAALPLLTVAMVPVLLGGVAGIWRPNRRLVEVLIWIVVPLSILILLAMRNVKPWNPRYAAMVFPLVLMVVCLGLSRLRRPLGLGLSILLTGLTLWSLGGYFFDSRYTKADVKTAAAMVAEANAEGDPILVPVVTAVFSKYYGGPGEILDTYGLPPLGNSGAADAFCDSLLVGRQKLYLVSARSWYFDPDGHLPIALARRGHLRTLGGTPGVKLQIWERDPDQGGP